MHGLRYVRLFFCYQTMKKIFQPISGILWPINMISSLLCHFNENLNKYA